MLHTLMFAAAFIAGSSSELRSTRMISVSLVEEWGSAIAGQREQPSAQKLPQKTHGKEAASKNLAAHRASPVMPLAAEQTVPAVKPEPMIQQSVPSANKDAGTEDSPMHITGSPNAGLMGSSSGAGIDFISQGDSSGSTSGTSATAGDGQQYGTAEDAALRQVIRAALQANLVYPYIARKKRMEGSVTVSFRINQTGNPEAIRILKGSGHSILDAAARDTVVKASPFPARNNSVKVPITFTLKDH